MTKEDKLCSYCKEFKKLEFFSINSKGKIHSRCKDCDKEYNANYHKNTYRFEKYLINKDIFDKMLIDQDYKCKICNQPLDRNCHIDHSHETNKVRGLLCGKCNKGLGLFNDDISIIEKAFNYLKQYNND